MNFSLKKGECLGIAGISGNGQSELFQILSGEIITEYTSIKFRDKEIQNVKHLLYEKIFQKGISIKADCIGLIKEKVDKELITIKVSFFKKNGRK